MDTDSTDDSLGPGPKADSADWRRSLREAGRYLGLGTQLALTMLLFVGGGYLVDRHFGMAPLMTVLGAIAGMVSMILYVLRIAREASGHRRGKGDSNGQAD